MNHGEKAKGLLHLDVYVMIVHETQQWISTDAFINVCVSIAFSACTGLRAKFIVKGIFI